MTTTPPSASTFAAVTVFCTQRPEATPIRFTPVNSATMPAPSHGIAVAPQPVSRTRNSAAATPIAAIAAVYIPRLSTQPTTNPAREPNASRTYTYLPPALGWRVASSAKHSAPRNARPPPSTQATKVSQGRPSCAATRPGVRKIPDPTMIPTTMARPSNSLSDRLRSAMGGECARKKVGAQRAAPLPVYPSSSYGRRRPPPFEGAEPREPPDDPEEPRPADELPPPPPPLLPPLQPPPPPPPPPPLLGRLQPRPLSRRSGWRAARSGCRPSGARRPDGSPRARIGAREPSIQGSRRRTGVVPGADTGMPRPSPVRLSSVPCGIRSRGLTPITVGADPERFLNTSPPPGPRARSMNKPPP